MKNYLLALLYLLTVLSLVAQAPSKSVKDSAKTKTIRPNFYEIRNKDFSQLINAATPGIAISYNQDKALINGSFTITKWAQQPHPVWIQLLPTVGTTTTFYDLKDTHLQLDYSIGASFTFMTYNLYYYDKDFSKNYDQVKALADPSGIETHFGFTYTPALHDKLNKTDPVLTSTARLYTAKRMEWITVLPEWGASKLTYYDPNRAFADQLYNPYFRNMGISASFNHYWYVNNVDVKWKGWPVTHFFYYKIAARFGTANNSEFLKKTSVNDITSSVVDPVSNTTRQVIKSSTGYKGVYEDYTAFTPSFEILYSFIPFFAFDIFGNYNFVNAQSVDHYGSLAAGLYFYTSSNSSKINIGIYYQHSLHVDPVKEIIGIKTKVPITW